MMEEERSDRGPCENCKEKGVIGVAVRRDQSQIQWVCRRCGCGTTVGLPEGDVSSEHRTAEEVAKKRVRVEERHVEVVRIIGEWRARKAGGTIE